MKRYTLLFLGITIELVAIFSLVVTHYYTWLIILHLLANSVLLIFLYILNNAIGKKDQWRVVYWFAWLLNLFFPGLGLFAGALVIVLVTKRIFGRTYKAGIYDEYEEYTAGHRLESAETAVFIDLMRKVRIGVSFEPFSDIIRGNDIKIKERVIEKLSRMTSADSVRLLKEALRDSSAEVRFYAAGSLLRMESSLNEKVQTALERTKQRGTARDFFFLGDLYRMYVEIGLVEKELTEHQLSLSCDAYQSSLDIDTNQPELVVNYSRSLIALKRYDKAKIILDRAIKIWGQNQEIIFLRCELYFKLGLIHEVVDSFVNINSENLDTQKKEIVELWKNVL